LAKPVLHVLGYRLQHASAAHVVAAVLNQREIAESAQRRLPRRTGIQTIPCELVGPHLHVKLQLLADLVYRCVAPEERAHSRDRDPDGGHPGPPDVISR
jgi:hypothetical protein